MRFANKYGVDIHHVIGSGWVQSHGMARKRLPEVEVRGEPDFLTGHAGAIIQEVCAYMIDWKGVVRLGEAMGLSPNTPVLCSCCSQHEFEVG